MGGIIFFATLTFMALVFWKLNQRSERNRKWLCYQCHEPIWIREGSFVHVGTGRGWEPCPPTQLPPSDTTTIPHHALPAGEEKWS